MSANPHPFKPTAAGTVNLAATNSTGSVALSPLPLNRKDVVVYNPGSTLAFVEFGGAAVTASASTGFPIPPGAQVRLHAGDNTYVAGIMASSTATLYFSSGVGD